MSGSLTRLPGCLRAMPFRALPAGRYPDGNRRAQRDRRSRAPLARPGARPGCGRRPPSSLPPPHDIWTAPGRIAAVAACGGARSVTGKDRARVARAAESKPATSFDRLCAAPDPLQAVAPCSRSPPQPVLNRLGGQPMSTGPLRSKLKVWRSREPSGTVFLGWVSEIQGCNAGVCVSCPVRLGRLCGSQFPFTGQRLFRDPRMADGDREAAFEERIQAVVAACEDRAEFS